MRDLKLGDKLTFSMLVAGRSRDLPGPGLPVAGVTVASVKMGSIFVDRPSQPTTRVPDSEQASLAPVDRVSRLVLDRVFISNGEKDQYVKDSIIKDSYRAKNQETNIA